MRFASAPRGYFRAESLAIGSYRLEVDDLVFDRSVSRPRNAMVLPDGWYVTASAIQATVNLLGDGRVRLNF